MRVGRVRSSISVYILVQRRQWSIAHTNSSLHLIFPRQFTRGDRAKVKVTVIKAEKKTTISSKLGQAQYSPRRPRGGRKILSIKQNRKGRWNKNQDAKKKTTR